MCIYRYILYIYIYIPLIANSEINENEIIFSHPFLVGSTGFL